MVENTLLLIKSNIKKSRRISIAFFLFIMLTVLLYHTGSQLTEGFKGCIRKKSLKQTVLILRQLCLMLFVKNIRMKLLILDR